ncbi:MAG: sugar phosphate isomerase/epimerase family protein [bacterium]
MIIRRRDFLISSLGAAAGLHTSALAAMAQTERRNRPPAIGIQLYCVRGEFEKDVPGTLKKVAELGYQGVEFYGYGGTENVFQDWPAEKLRALLDENKIRCCGIHMSVGAIQGDALARTVKNNEILGNRFLIVAAATDYMESPEKIGQFAKLLNETAEKVREQRMRVGYHCHAFDFKKINDQTGWDLLFSQAAPNVVMQVDTGNCAEGGGDPIAILKKFPNRAATFHVKGYAGAPLQADNPVWKEIIQLCKDLHRTRWYIVEEGEAENQGFGIAQASIECLKKMI